MAGYDASAYWARGGIAHVLTPADRDFPDLTRGAMGDRNGGMSLAFGIAGALLKRARTGAGSVVDVSLLASAIWTASSDVLSALPKVQNRGPWPDGRFSIRSSTPIARRTVATFSSSSFSRTAIGAHCAIWSGVPTEGRSASRRPSGPGCR